MGGWLSTYTDSPHPAEYRSNPNALFEIAEASYLVADAMLAARGKYPVTDDNVINSPQVLFVGGPLEGMQYLSGNPQYVDYEGEQYHRNDIVIEGRVVKIFYVWSELSSEEADKAVDVVLSTKKESN
jgi:hypothetical protein